MANNNRYNIVYYTISIDCDFEKIVFIGVRLSDDFDVCRVHYTALRFHTLNTSVSQTVGRENVFNYIVLYIFGIIY
jgi:hypothetical protein